MGFKPVCAFCTDPPESPVLTGPGVNHSDRSLLLYCVQLVFAGDPSLHQMIHGLNMNRRATGTGFIFNKMNSSSVDISVYDREEIHTWRRVAKSQALNHSVFLLVFEVTVIL